MSNFNERKSRKIEFLRDLNNVLVKHDAEIIADIQSTNGGMDDGMFMYFDLNQGDYCQFDQELDHGDVECRIDSNTIYNILNRLNN